MSNVARIDPQPKKKLLEKLADRYSVAPDIFERTVSAVAMPNPHTREELISCLIVANEHDLNPLTKEIHFMRDKTGKIHPIVGIDGWVKKLNSHPQFNGFEFQHEFDANKKLVAVTCRVYRKDRDRPVEATELMSECIRLPAQGKGPNAWVMTPSRMLRHRALMQCARYAIGFGGVMDLDEFERWQEMKDVTPKAVLPVPADIPDETEQTPAVAEDINQDPQPLADPNAYLANLEENLALVGDAETLKEVWDTHLDLVPRLSGDDVAKAEGLHQQHKKRISKNKKGAE